MNFSKSDLVIPVYIEEGEKNAHIIYLKSFRQNESV